MPSFTVTAARKNVKLDSSGTAQAPYTVTNTSAQTLRGTLLTKPGAPARPEWFSVVGESIRNFVPNTPEQVVVRLDAPPGSTPGSYSFRLDAVSQVMPDEDFTEGPTVAFEVKPPRTGKPFPWHIVIVAGGFVLLILIVVVVVIVT